LRQEDPARGQIIEDLLDQPHRLISPIVLDNIVFNVGAPAVGYGQRKAITSRGGPRAL
jgi:Mg2+/Co2+ transporter CorB